MSTRMGCIVTDKSGMIKWRVCCDKKKWVMAFFVVNGVLQKTGDHICVTKMACVLEYLSERFGVFKTVTYRGLADEEKEFTPVTQAGLDEIVLGKWVKFNIVV